MSGANRVSFLLLSAIVVISALAYGTVHQPTIAIFYLAVAALTVLWAIDGWQTGEFRFSTSAIQLPVLAAVVYGLIQTVPFGTFTGVAGVDGIPRTISLDPYSTQIASVHLLFLFLFFAVVLTVVDSGSRLRKLAGLITIFGTVYAFFAILQSVLSPDKIYGIYERAFAAPFGSFVSRHNFAAYMEMTVAIPLGLLFVGAVPRDKRFLYGIASALMGTALLLSGSRGGLVAFIAEIGLLLLLTVEARSARAFATRALLASILLVVIIGGSIFVGGETSLTRIAEGTSNTTQSIDRSYIWRITLGIIRDNFPLGAGLGAFGVAFTPLDERSGAERVEQAHNDYLQIAADAGIVGLTIAGFFLFALYKAARSALRVHNRYRRGIAVGAVSGVFAILVHSIFDFVLHTTAISVLFMVLLAMLVASSKRYNDDVKDAESKLPHRRRIDSVKPIDSRRRPAKA